MSNLINSDFLDKQEEDNIINNLFLGFIIEDEKFAIEISNIKEIIRVQPIAIVPHTENYIKGIMNLRGDIVPVVDVRLRFMKPETPHTERTCVVVVLYQDYILGLIVDDILGVYPINDDMISAPPSAKLSFHNQFVKNIGRCEEGIMLILDLERLIF